MRRAAALAPVCLAALWAALGRRGAVSLEDAAAIAPEALRGLDRPDLVAAWGARLTAPSQM